MGKIIIFGDSISYGKWDSHGGWVARLRNYIDKKYNLGQNKNFQVYNMGIPGEVAPRLSERFEFELKYRIDPDENNLIVLSIGINDSNPNNLMIGSQTSEKELKKSIQNMIDISKKYNCKVVCIGLTPVNPEKSKGMKFSNTEVKKYDQYLTEICRTNKILKLDWFDELLNQNLPSLLVDSVHPNNEGHEIMTNKIIKFLNDNKLIESCL